MIRLFRFPGLDPIPQQLPKDTTPQPNTAFFCPACAKVYALVSHEPNRYSKAPWGTWINCCPDCPTAWSGMVPGSLLTATELANDPSLPEAVVRREFDLHLQAYDKWNQHDSN